MLKRTIVNFLIFILFAQNVEATVKTIHAILVADNVSDISFLTQADLKNIQNELKLVSKHTKIVLKEKTFSSSTFKKENVASYLKNLNISKDDGVVFYFSGHGYRTLQKETKWPFLSFELYKKGLDMQWVIDTIWSKKPQFALILADCCNNYAEAGLQRTTKKIMINLNRISPNYSGYKQLFVNASGCVAVCSSSAGQFSYGSQKGGIFTMCFLSSLNREISQPKPSWGNLMQRACSYMNHVQKPICQIFTHNKS